MSTELTFVELGTVDQLFEFSALVCVSSRQPVWSAGQEKLIAPAEKDIETVMGVVEVGLALAWGEFALSPAGFTAETT